MHEFIQIIRQMSSPLVTVPASVEPRLASLPEIKAVIFDVYGTLFISSSGDISQQRSGPEEALKKLLHQFDIDRDVLMLDIEFTETVHREHAIMQEDGVEYPEVRYEEIWDHLFGFHSKRQSQEFALRHEMIVNPVFPMAYALPLMTWLSQHQISLGLLSNAQFFTPLLFPAFFEKDLSQLGFYDELILFSFEMGRAKPSIELFLEEARRLKALKIRPRETLFVGNDMLNDIVPAQQAGFRTALFAGDIGSYRPRHNHPLCGKVVPDLIITKLDQLLDCIEGAV